MFDIYESVKNIEIPGVESHIQSQFAAWCHLNGVTELNNTLKDRYLEENLEGEGDVLDQILAQGDNVKSYLCFWKLNFDKVVLAEVPLAYSPEKINTLKNIWTVEKLSSYLGVNLEEQKAVVHFVDDADQPLQFFYFRFSGAIFIVSGSFEDVNVKDKFDIDFVEFFKALSDSTRLKIVFALANGAKTSTELAEICDVTLSTINHHLKILAEEKLTQLHLSSKEGRGASFILNLEILKHKIEVFNQLLQS